MALLAMCVQEHICVLAAFVNYHQRKQADAEQAYVTSWCHAHHVPLAILDVPFTWSGNFEAAARTWRYDFFEKLVKENKYDGILVAHHQDDLIETWMMQKERGIVPKYYGLNAVSYWHDILVYRPLLSYRKQELEAYCTKNQIVYFVDETNLHGENRRSQLRQEGNLSKQEREEILKEIETANADLALIREEAASCLEAGGIDLQVYLAKREEVRLSALRQYLDPDNRFSCTNKQMKEIDDLCHHDDFCLDFHGSLIGREKQHVYQVPAIGMYQEVYESVCCGSFDRYVISSSGSTVEAVSVKEDDFPLMIRSVLPGDAIQMRFGHKSVHRFFVDRHIPRALRSGWPVVVNARGDLILVPGLGCDVNHYSHSPSLYVHAFTLAELQPDHRPLMHEKNGQKEDMQNDA